MSRRTEFPVDTVELARYLIDKVALHESDDERLGRRIVETSFVPSVMISRAGTQSPEAGQDCGSERELPLRLLWSKRPAARILMQVRRARLRAP
jgi:hypothetical protein